MHVMTLNECCVYPQALAEEATASKAELEALRTQQQQDEQACEHSLRGV